MTVEKKAWRSATVPDRRTYRGGGDAGVKVRGADGRHERPEHALLLLFHLTLPERHDPIDAGEQVLQRPVLDHERSMGLRPRRTQHQPPRRPEFPFPAAPAS